MINTKNDPKSLATVTLTNKNKPAKLAAYQSMLTEMSKNDSLKGITLTIPKNVDHRGLNSGCYWLVDILKTLGNETAVNDTKNKDLAETAVEQALSQINSSNKNVVENSVFSAMLEIEDMHIASIKTESDKKSAFVKGFYLLRPLLEVLHTAMISTLESKMSA
ncbi:MAG: hypothetical protein J6N72_02250 [Psychrobacter sp.]|nr:hypothetical protein [Psychrobacter sp.]